MESKKRILIVGDYNRRDFVAAFYECKNYFEFYFIEYASESEVKTEFYKDYGQAIFWKDYKDAYGLLQEIKPYKVVFFFIESYNHVALNIACKKLKIPSFHLEHGFRDYKLETNLLKNYEAPSPGRSNFIGLIFRVLNIKDTIDKVKTKLFFFRTVYRTSGNEKIFLKEFYDIRRVNNVFNTFKKIVSNYRTADCYISYSPAIFQAHVEEDHLQPEHPVKYIGISGFDNWVNIKSFSVEEKNIIFIHQPLAHQGLLGWTGDFETNFIEKFIRFCEKNRYKLLIKKHPYDYSNYWDFAIEEGKVIMLNNEEFLSQVAKTKIIVGFFSTMLLPIAALPHTILFSFEGHPDEEVLPSEFLLSSGVCEPFCNFNEFEEKLKNVKAIENSQKLNKPKFIDHWMYRFDGNSGKRLCNILIDEK